MGRTKTILAAVLVLLAVTAFPQKKDTVKKVRLNHYTLTIGGGWTHYIDNLDNGNNGLKKNFFGGSFKFYWEPEYRLSLGLETGYYQLFSNTYTFGDTTAEVTRTTVPMLLLVRMRIVDNFYLGAGLGLAFITNKTTGIGSDIITKTTSLSNFEFSAAYIYPLGKHWLLGGEVKAFHFANLDDWMYSVQATFGVKL
jgi:hypothetical protein